MNVIRIAYADKISSCMEYITIAFSHNGIQSGNKGELPVE